MLAPPQLKNTKTSKSNSGNSGFTLPFEQTSEAENDTENKDSLPANIQPKLKVNTPGDEFEQEADSVADNVMRKKAPVAIMRKCSKCGTEHEVERKEDEEKEENEEGEAEPGVMRKCAACAAEDEEKGLQRKDKDGKQSETSDTFHTTLNSTKGGGDNMDEGTRAEMESRFGANFGDVKIHTDGTSQKLNDDVSAHAFTHGKDVYFNKGQYNPGTEEGKKLLAHELTHTIQQGAVNQDPEKAGENNEQNGQNVPTKDSTEVLQPVDAANAVKEKVDNQLGTSGKGKNPITKDGKKDAKDEGEPESLDKIKEKLPTDKMKMISGLNKKDDKKDKGEKKEDGEKEGEEEGKEGEEEDKPLTLPEVLELSLATLSERGGLSTDALVQPIILNTAKTGLATEQIDEDMAEVKGNAILDSARGKIQMLIGKSTEILPQLQIIADQRRALVQENLEKQIAANLAQCDALKTKTQQETGAAMGAIAGKYSSAKAQVTGKQKKDKDALKVAYDASTKMLADKKTAQLTKIITDLDNGRTRIESAGRVIASLAYTTAQTEYNRQNLLMPPDEDDSILDGNVTYRKAKARRDVIMPIGEQYRDSLNENATTQANDIISECLKESFRKQVNDAATETQKNYDDLFKATNDAIDGEATAALGKLKAGYDLSVKGMLDTQNNTMLMLDMQQKAQTDALREQATLQLASIDTFVIDYVNNVTTGVISAVDGIESAMVSFRESMNAWQELPAKEDLNLLFDETNVTLENAFGQTWMGLEDGVVKFTDVMETTCLGIEGAFAELCASFTVEQTDGQSTVQPALDAVRNGYMGSASEIASSSGKKMTELAKPAFDTYKTAEDSVKESFAAIDGKIEDKIKTSISTVESQFKHQIDGSVPAQQPAGDATAPAAEQVPDPCPIPPKEAGGGDANAEEMWLTKQIEAEGQKAADAEKPRWKTWAKYLLTALVIVASILLTPFTGGASLGMLVLVGAIVGAVSAAIISIGSQLIDNGTVDWKEVAFETALGAVGGVFSAFGGAGVMKILGSGLVKGLSAAGTKALGNVVSKYATVFVRETFELATDAVTGMASEVIVRTMFGKPIDLESLLTGAAFGMILGASLKGGMSGLGRIKGFVKGRTPHVDATPGATPHVDATPGGSPRPHADATPGGSPHPHADATPGGGRPHTDADVHPNGKPKTKAETPEDIGKRMQNDEGVTMKAKTEDGHTVKADADGNIVKCSECKLFEFTHRAELDANPHLADELAELRKKMSKGADDHDWSTEILAIENKLNKARPKPEPGYHWKTKENGEMVYSKNPGHDGPQRIFDPETRTFKDKAITDPALQRSGLPEPGTEAHTKWQEYELSPGKKDKLPCFMKGTLIKTPSGERKIEDMQVGDEIFTMDSLAFKVVVGTVTELHRNWTHTVVKITLENNEVIEATGKHPIWVIESEDWIAASNLEIGWTLWGINGSEVKIKNIEAEKRIADTYNFEVSPHHMYFVGQEGVLVHNDDGVSKYLDTKRVNGTIYTIADRTGKIIYVGQTIEGFDTRFDHHLKDPKSAVYQYLQTNHPELMNDGKFSRADVSDVLSTHTPIENKPLTLFELSVWEQHYINEHGPIGKEGGPLENKINSITEDKYNTYRELHNPCD